MSTHFFLISSPKSLIILSSVGRLTFNSLAVLRFLQLFEFMVALSTSLFSMALFYITSVLISTMHKATITNTLTIVYIGYFISAVFSVYVINLNSIAFIDHIAAHNRTVTNIAPNIYVFYLWPTHQIILSVLSRLLRFGHYILYKPLHITLLVLLLS